jgi:hypothetical protein
MNRSPDPQADGPTGRSLTGTLIALFYGPIFWGAHLSVVYGLQTGACALGWPTRPGVWIIAVTAAILVPLLVGLAAPRVVLRLLRASGWPGEDCGFLGVLVVVLSLLSAAGVAWAGATVLFIGACPPLR